MNNTGNSVCEDFSEHLRNLEFLSIEKKEDSICQYCLRESNNLKKVPYWDKYSGIWRSDLICPECINENGYLITKS